MLWTHLDSRSTGRTACSGSILQNGRLHDRQALQLQLRFPLPGGGRKQRRPPGHHDPSPQHPMRPHPHLQRSLHLCSVDRARGRRFPLLSTQRGSTSGCCCRTRNSILPPSTGHFSENQGHQGQTTGISQRHLLIWLLFGKLRHYAETTHATRVRVNSF